MSKPMTAFTTDFQHSGMVAKDLDETIAFYTEKLGFEVAGIFHNGENRCAFLRYGHLTIETWEGEPAPMTTGAINHWAFDTPDIEAAFENAKELGLKFKDTEIQHIDSFWGARHPLLQRVRSERRDHRVLPDRLIVRLIKTRGVPIHSNGMGTPLVFVYVFAYAFFARMQTHIARVPSHFRVADVRDVGLHESQRGADDVLVFHAQALAQREAGVVERAFLID